MPLIDGSLEGWRINRINAGPPYCVETIKYPPGYSTSGRRESEPQVCDERGTVALSGPGGAVFCATHEQAEALCALANAGQLERD